MGFFNLPTYISLSEAIARYAVSVQTLTQAIEDETIQAIRINDEILVADEDVSLLLPIDTSVSSDLHGKPIRAAEAVEKYAVTDVNLSRWANAGYIRVLERGPKFLLLDEGEVQRAAEIFHCAYQTTGSYVRAGWVLKRALSCGAQV